MRIPIRLLVTLFGCCFIHTMSIDAAYGAEECRAPLRAKSAAEKRLAAAQSAVVKAEHEEVSVSQKKADAEVQLKKVEDAAATADSVTEQAKAAKEARIAEEKAATARSEQENLKCQVARSAHYSAKRERGLQNSTNERSEQDKLCQEALKAKTESREASRATRNAILAERAARRELEAKARVVARHRRTVVASEKSVVRARERRTKAVQAHATATESFKAAQANYDQCEGSAPAS